MTPDPAVEHAARRRALLRQALADPADTEVKQRLAALVAGSGRSSRTGAVTVLAVVALACAVLSLIALIGGLDVTAVLLAVAGLYALLLIHRRRS